MLLPTIRPCRLYPQRLPRPETHIARFLPIHSEIAVLCFDDIRIPSASERMLKKLGKICKENENKLCFRIQFRFGTQGRCRSRLVWLPQGESVIAAWTYPTQGRRCPTGSSAAAAFGRRAGTIPSRRRPALPIDQFLQGIPA